MTNEFSTGPVVGRFCIDLAIEKAKSVGIGWVCAKGKEFYFNFHIFDASSVSSCLI